jgi:chromosome partitioning protein
MGQNNLVIDLDPQGNATTGFGKSNSDEEKNIYNLLIRKINLNQVIQKTNIKNLDIIGSHVNLSGLEVETASDSKRAFVLKEILSSEKIGLLKRYDNIFIDCPPSLSLLTIMSLVASDELLVPLQTEFFALEGITQLVKTIDRIKENLNPSLSIRGILLTMFDKRNKLSAEVDREARNYFKDKTVIQRNVRLSEAPSHGLPCVIYDKSCVGSKSYFKLAEEFKNNLVSAA